MLWLGHTYPMQVSSTRQPHIPHVQLFKFDFGVLYAVPIIVFGFSCHANVVAIFSELSNNANPVIMSALPPTWTV